MLTIDDLFIAVKDNNISQVKHILDNYSFNMNVYKCVYKCGYESGDKTKTVIGCKNKGETVLHIACNQRLMDIIKLLCDSNKINVNALNSNGETVLNTAYNDTDMVKLLLNFKYINVNRKDSNGNIPLYSACVTGNKEVVKLLLAHPKIKINELNNNGVTALCYLCCYENKLVITTLFLHYIMIDVDQPKIEKPLICAIESNNINTLRLLLQQSSINVNHLDIKSRRRGITPLDHAFFCQKYCREHNKYRNMIKLLLEYGANITFNIRCNYGGDSAVNQWLSSLDPTRKQRDKYSSIAHLFTIIVLLCDEYFTLIPTHIPLIKNNYKPYYNMIRFFKIVNCVPMEVQMLICHRVYGSTNSYVKSDLVTLYSRSILNE